MTTPTELGFIALVGLPAGFLALRGLSRSRRRGPSGIEIARRSLQTCDALLRMIGHMQQHRGMSSAWLGGDRNFTARLAAKRAEIDVLFPPLYESAKDELKQATPCMTPNDLDLFRFRWRSLMEGLAGMTVEKSIAEHTHLIATALDWLDAFGEARVGLSLTDRLPLGLVKNYAHRLPALTECLGQARAIGSGVAARGKCSAVARVRLMFLVSRAESLLEQACSIRDGKDQDVESARRAVQSLATLIRTHMLASEGVDVAADTYFGQATAAIEGVFSWIRDCGRGLEQRLV